MRARQLSLAAAIAAIGGELNRGAADQFSATGRLVKQEFSQAPTLRPVDYLHGVRILAATDDWLFGVPEAAPGSVYKYDRTDFSGILVYAFGTTGGRNVNEIVVQDNLTIWCEWAVSTTNSQLVRLTATDRTWASCSVTNTLYIGGDDINASETNTLLWATDGSATATMYGYRFLSHASMAFDASGNAWVAEYSGATEIFEYAVGRVYAAGDLVYPTTPNGCYYVVGTGGGTAGAEPTWPTTRGQSVVSGATFYCASNQYTGQRMRLLKLAAGASTWTVEWTVNGGANLPLCRHLHCVRYNPYTDSLWFSAGDRDKWGDGNVLSSTNRGAVDHTWSMSWDMSAALPNNPTIASLEATTGVKLFSGAQRFRAVDFTFTEDGGYFWSDASPTNVSSFSNQGVFRISHDFGVCERIGTPQAQGEVASGYYGIKTAAGSMVFIPATGTDATLTERVVPIFTASADGSDMAYAGQVAHVAGGSIPYGVFYDDVSGYCFASLSGLAGKGTPARQTVVFRVLDSTPHNFIGYDGQKIDREPEVLHPVYWVKATGTNDTTGDRGYSPRNPWQTLTYALTGSRVTPGARVVPLDASLTFTAGITCAWTANANPGDAALPVQVDFRGVAVTHNFNGAMFQWSGSAAQHLQVLADNLTYGPSTGTSSSVVDFSACTANCNVSFIDSLVGYLGHTQVAGTNLKPAAGARLVYGGPGTLTLKRSRFPFGNMSEIVQTLGTKPAKLVVTLEDSAVDDLLYFFRWPTSPTSTDDEIYINYSFVYGRTFPITFGGGAVTFTGKLRGKNSALISGGASLLGGQAQTFPVMPLQSCVTNAPLGMTVTAADTWETNSINSTEVQYAKSIYVPRDPGQGDWRDDRYPGVGPRVPLLPDPWLV